MKTRLMMAGLLVGAACSAEAASPLRIKATKQLESRKNSGNQNAFGGSTSLTQKEYFYRFDAQAIGPQGVGALKFEWVVMKEDWEGRVHQAEHGSCTTNVAMTRAVSVETDTVHLTQRNVQGGGRSGKFEDKIAGYGLKVSDANGNLLAEEYDPTSMKKEIDWKAEEEVPREEALRALKTLLGGDRDGGGDRRPPGPPPMRR